MSHTTPPISARLTGAIGAALLAVHVGLLAWMAYRQSPTIDEPGHLVAGISYWKLGRFDLYAVNPPLAKLAGALPVLALQPNLDVLDSGQMHSDPPRIQGRSRPEFTLGREFIEDNGPRIFRLMTVARWACIPFSLLGGLVCYRWGSELYGRLAGLLALALWCVFPEVLAHGSLLTADLPAAAMGALAGYSFWRWLKEPIWSKTCVMGIALGLALLTKFTWLVLIGLWPLLWLIGCWAVRASGGVRRGRLCEAAQMAAALGLAIAEVNAGYLFQGSFNRLGDYDFVSAPLTGGPSNNAPDWKPGNRFRDTWLASLRVPLPEAFVHGVDLQRSDFENYEPAYLGGRLYPGGRWYFYLYAAAVKWPLGFWLLLVFSVMAGRGEERGIDRLVLLVPPVVLLILMSAAGSPSFLRYYLPAMPFLFVWCARLAAAAALVPLRRCVPTAAAGAWLIVSSLRVFPHSLAYFNEAAGGPQHGAEHLIDSHIDWGQDLLELRRWLERHPEVHDLRLAYHGKVDPRLAGIDFRDIEPDPVRGSRAALSPGWYAVSVHALSGGLWRGYTADGEFESRSRPELYVFHDYEPIDRVGYSILIYRIGMPAAR